ncbi:winged helix-turn-helix transcriptional regulator [Amycolatopsis rhizosphaerae]|uniref:Winged helix-turn-helix transcriptional regulator n=1 Tax=Amycolatopsis rhizosphaerae TaxID=2053003 RepID=A0A558DGV5_9PSEU|nr:winged helix-turn-helix domain-containing protein [Amycolatopsis rhizosphaerae]TVT60123.1 winged helix-turn-helix transcriptional regulator [Amycolatopsis rhizosphaerae]
MSVDIHRSGEREPVFDPGSNPIGGYVYEQLADHLADLIARGILRAYTALPSERRLAEEYGVSLGTARHATKLLRERGLLVTVRSKGTYIAPRPDGEGAGGESDKPVQEAVLSMSADLETASLT